MLCCWRITNLAEKDQITVGMIGMFKAWITERGRLICSLAREVLGGNGITHDLYVMKTLCDMEALYTYEGTYDINTLVAGHELTGVRAIR